VTALVPHVAADAVERIVDWPFVRDRLPQFPEAVALFLERVIGCHPGMLPAILAVPGLVGALARSGDTFDARDAAVGALVQMVAGAAADQIAFIEAGPVVALFTEMLDSVSREKAAAMLGCLAKIRSVRGVKDFGETAREGWEDAMVALAKAEDDDMAKMAEALLAAFSEPAEV
jgi:hypothetical protein